MAGFGLGSLDNIARQAIGGLDSLTPELTRELGEALAHSNPRRALDDWRAKAVDFNPELARILNDSNMVRLASVPEAGRIYDEFNTALMNGTAASAESYSARIVETLSLRGESAEQVTRELNQFADDFEAGIASTGLPREEALARYRQRWAAENGTGAGDGARTAEAPRDTPPRSEGFNGRAAADTATESTNKSNLGSRITRTALGTIRWPFSRNVTVGGAIALANAPLILAAADNATGHKLSEAVLDTPLEPILENILALGTWASNEKAAVPAHHIEQYLIEHGHINPETDDPARYEQTQALIMAVSHAAIGQPYSAVLSLDGVDMNPDDVVAAWAKARRDHPELSIREQGALAFNDLMDQVDQQRTLTAQSRAQQPSSTPYAEDDVAANDGAVIPDTHMQGGSQAGTPAAVLADQRRRTEGGLETEEAVEAGRRLVDQARDAVASQGINSTNFSVAALSGASLASVFDKVAGDNWLMKVGNWIAGLFGERAQAGFQRLALAQSDTQEVYAAFRESAAEGRLVSNDPGSDRFGVMSLLDFGPEPDALEAG